jgi:aminoglycoside phosphotransferase
MAPPLRAGPPGPVSVPDAVAAVAGRRPVRAVWRNERGAVTFEVGTGPDRCFVKWAPVTSGIDLGAEAVRLQWAHPFTPVPRVLGAGGNDDGSWFVTSPIPGESAVADRWKADPATAVAAIGTGLRAWHDQLPVNACPYSWSAEGRFLDARRRAGAGQIDPARWDRDHRSLSVEEALDILADIPPPDALVVCHGDACAPNTVLTKDGRCSGHVDLGALGVADRWADIAVATWSTQWNYGPGWEDLLLAAYGIDLDLDRTRYYRLLWDLGP